MLENRLLSTVTAALALLPAVLCGTNMASAQQATSTQTSPLATEPLPTQGPGQAATGAAVTGSAPGPGASGTLSTGPAAPSTIDASQAQQGVLLKPGEAADNMNAAAGAKTTEQPK